MSVTYNRPPKLNPPHSYWTRFYKRWVIILFTSLIFFSSLFAFNQTIIEQNRTSMVRVPAYYYFKELAQSINHHFQVDKQGIMCEDDSYTNNNNDNFKVVCHQLSDIKISSAENKVITEVKVRVNAQFLINYELNLDLWFTEFNHVFTFERPLGFDLLVKFFTSINIDSDLTTQSHTDWEYEWLTLPYISFGPISFRVLDETEPKVAGVIDQYAQDKIDKTILEDVNINKILHQVWEEFEAPIQLNNEFNLWNFFHLQDIRSGGIFVDEEKFIFPFEIKFNNYTGFGSNLINNNFELTENVVPERFNYNNISFTNKQFYLRMPLKLTIPDIEKLIFNDITQKDYVFGTGNLQLKVTEVYLAINRNFIVSEVYLRSVSESTLLGSLVLRITFNPFYDVANKKLRARYLTYEIVRSDTVLVDIFNAVQKQDFARLLQDTIVLEFDTYVKSIHELINDKLGNYVFNEKLVFQTVVDQIDIKNIFIQEKEVYMIVDLNGHLELYLQNLF